MERDGQPITPRFYVNLCHTMQYVGVKNSTFPTIASATHAIHLIPHTMNISGMIESY